MQIAITCPECGRKSKIEDQFQGKRMRCPYPDCNRPFMVLAGGQTEAIASDSDEDAPQVASWQDAPPPVQEVTDWQSSPPSIAVDEAEQSTDGDVIAPSLEAGGKASTSSTITQEDKSKSKYYVQSGKGAHRLLLVFIVGGLVIAGIAGWFIWQAIQENELELAAEADQLYQDGQYAQAERKYRQILDAYPGSNRTDYYRFFAELSAIRNYVQSSTPNPEKAWEQLQSLDKQFQKSDLYQDHRQEIWSTTAKLTENALFEAKRQTKRELLRVAESAYQLAQRISTRLPTEEQEGVGRRHQAISKDLTEVRKLVHRQELRQKMLQTVKNIIQDKNVAGIELIQRQYQDAVTTYPELADDAELTGALNQLKSHEPSWVGYEANPKPLPVPPELKEGQFKQLAICPLVSGTPATATDNDEIVFAQSQGVLYALSEQDGSFRWAYRVGLDVQQLPIRIPGGSPGEEYALIVSSEYQTITAIAMQTGKIIWQQYLGADCRAGPVLGIDRVYVPTVDGKVHVFNTIDGRLIERFHVGQPLTIPGTFDASSRRLYLPADYKRLYVFDVSSTPPRCVAILYTGHESGTLRHRPIVHGSIIILSESQQLDRMVVRVFQLSSQGSDVEQQGEYPVQGWSWFEPYFNGDTLGLVTDQGYLALFATRRGTRDAAVFPLLQAKQQQYFGHPLNAETSQSQPPAGRSLLVDMHLQEWWTVQDGYLRRHYYDEVRQRIRNVGRATEIGNPLQDSQLSSQGQHLILVTQTGKPVRTLVTALERATGKLLWQRQLGISALQPGNVIQDQLYQVDTSGGIWQVNVQELLQQKSGWQASGKWLPTDIPQVDSTWYLLSHEKSWMLIVTYEAEGEQLTIRKLEVGKGQTLLKTYGLALAPRGKPVITERTVLLPCSDGNLHEFPIAEDGKERLPLNWRHPNAGEGARCYALCPRVDMLIASDGMHRLQIWKRDPQGNWRKEMDSKYELRSGVIASEILYYQKEGKTHVCVGDDGGNLYLFGANRQWQLGGKITAGPFLRGGWIGCVVADKRLLWLDAEQEKPLWEYQTDQDSIVGEPQLIGKLLLISEQPKSNVSESYAYTWVDPRQAAKQRIVKRVRLPGQVIPACAAYACHEKLVVAPLSDGSMLLLDVVKGE